MFALYTPEMMPTMMGRANSRMEETPKMYRQTIVTSVVSVVLMDMFWIWNDFMVPLIMMNNERLMTIQLSISRLFGQYASKWDIALPALVMTILPIVIVFILLQKKIMDGVIAGAVKG